MSKSRKLIAGALLILNIVLLISLSMPVANAATFKSTDYIINAGHVSGGHDGVTIIDQAKGKMIVLYWDEQAKRISKLGSTQNLSNLIKD